jgi:hypothetical protein
MSIVGSVLQPLVWAAESSCLPMVEALLAHGADIEAKNEVSVVSVSTRVYIRHRYYLFALMYRTHKNGETALDVARERARVYNNWDDYDPNNREIVELLETWGTRVVCDADKQHSSGFFKTSPEASTDPSSSNFILVTESIRPIILDTPGDTSSLHSDH